MTENNRFSPASEKGHFDGLVDEGKYLRQSSLYKQIMPRTQSRPKTSTISVNPVILSISSSCPSCASWLQKPFNQRNLCPRYPRLINDLRLRKITYEKINLFLQNEPNFRKSQVNVSDLLKRNYDQLDTWSIRKNEPKTNPNEPKTNPNPKKAEMNVTTCLTMNYEQRTMNDEKKRTQTNPKRTRFQRQFWRQTMPNLTIKTRPKPLASCTDQTEHDCPGRRMYGQRPKMPNRSLIQMNNRKYLTLMVFPTILALTPSGNLHANPKSSNKSPRPTALIGWKTNTAKRTIEFNELILGSRAIQGELKAIYCRPLSTEAISHLHGCFSSQRLKYIPSKISLIDVIW